MDGKTLIINTGAKAFDKEPSHDGVTEGQEKIWSKNTGRTANGEMVGDIIAIKTTLSVKYPPLNQTERDQLDLATRDSFFNVQYLGRTLRMYASSPSFPLYDNVDGKSPRYVGVGIDLIEK